MIKFKSQELEDEIREVLDFINEVSRSDNGLNLDELEYTDGTFISDNDVLITEDYIISVDPDYSDIFQDFTVRGFIDLIKETKESKILNSQKCLSPKRCLIKIEGKTYEDTRKINSLLNYSEEKFLQVDLVVNNMSITCSIVHGLTIFGLKTHFEGNYDKYYPSVLNDDKFVEIYYGEGSLDENQIDAIFQSYIFELSDSLKINLMAVKREEDVLDFDDEDLDDFDTHLIRPLAFGKGIDELLVIFNKADMYPENYDYTITEYTKIIEYVSQTIITNQITEQAIIKLSSSRALRPDANFVQELRKMFIDDKLKYESDRNAVKITIEKCCDIDEILDCDLPYLTALKAYKKAKIKGDKDINQKKESAIGQLSDAISNTRNNLSHAKPNYTAKGLECPEKFKPQYTSMLRVLVIQVIRWYSNLGEVNRVTD